MGAPTGSGKFKCPACGKLYVWRLVLAGKRAKCSCGQMMDVPDAPDTTIPQSPPIAKRISANQSAVAAAPPAQMLGYVSTRTQRAEKPQVDKLIDPVRDTYVPLGLLICGFMGIVLWSLLALATSARLGVVVLFASGVTTLIKTAVLVGLALLIAPKVGLSLGTFWSATLKLAAIVIFTDALLMWVEELMEHLGALPQSGYRRGWGRIRWIELLLTATFIAFMARYLFDMDEEETGWVAFPIAITSWIVGLILKLILIAVLNGVAAASAASASAGGGTTGAAPPAMAGTPSATAPLSPPPRADVTPRDRIISTRLQQKDFLLKPVDEIQQTLRGRGQKRLLESLLDAGATRQFVDRTKLGLGGTLYVELPLAPAGRTACFDAYKNYCGDSGQDVDPGEATDDGRRYLVITLKAK